MTPSNEKEVINALGLLSDNLTNNSPGLAAYPQLQGTFYALQVNLQDLVGVLVAAQRDEALYGKTEAAKLYLQQYRQKHSLPQGILKSVMKGMYSETCKRPITTILAYAIAHRGLSTESSLWINPDAATTYVKVFPDTQEVTLSWFNRAMSITMPDLGKGVGLVNAPLFHEPIPVDMNMAYLDNVLYTPLYERLVGDEHREVTDPKYLLMDHYFLKDGEATEENLDHPLVQLRALLNGSMYGRTDASHVYAEWKDYRLLFSTERDWNHDSSLLLKVSVNVPSTDPTARHHNLLHGWWHNPLLVNDLLKDMDDIIDQLLTRHEAELADRPNTV